LTTAGVRHLLPAVLEEIPRVREDFGWPIMVTPLSQIVGGQAAANVIVGQRYAEVTDLALEFCLGLHGGEEAVAGIDPDVLARILDRPRAREIRDSADVAAPSLAELRSRFPALDDEDLILVAILGEHVLERVGRTRELPENCEPYVPIVEMVRSVADAAGPGTTRVSLEQGSIQIRK
jgi:oxaloacetate decarboxylase (Na+ extruding) subunit alpha